MINVFSEIGILQEILLHRPSYEVENLTPETKDRLLFDDIPFLKVARAEHDFFAKLLKDKGTKVLYLEQLIAETLKQSQDIKKEFLNQFLKEAKFNKGYLYSAIFDYLNSLKEEDLITEIIEGVKSKKITIAKPSLYAMANKEKTFFCDPMPNLIFTRDNFASIGNGATLNTMYSNTRNRECILAEYIFKYHPDFKDTPLYYNRFENSCIEGGDELILNENTLAIGISQRTESASIEKLANRLFNSDSSFRRILAFKIPNKRAFMHLDTVFTQIDVNKFTVHPEAEAALEVFKLTPSGKGLHIELEENTLQHILSDALKVDAKLLQCGGGDPLVAAREQWNDGSNTLAIAPGEVVVYSRNYITNQILRDNGIIVHEIPSSELSRGRGGPRCMSMPIKRLKLNN